MIIGTSDRLVGSLVVYNYAVHAELIYLTADDKQQRQRVRYPCFPLRDVVAAIAWDFDLEFLSH